MNRSSKYDSLASIISSVEATALDHAENGYPSHDGADEGSHSRLVMPKNTRHADRQARDAARRAPFVFHLASTFE